MNAALLALLALGPLLETGLQAAAWFLVLAVLVGVKIGLRARDGKP